MTLYLDADLLLDAHASVGECPVWWPGRNLLAWVDPPARVVHLTDPATREDRVVSLESEVSAIAPATDGRLVVAVEDGIGFLDVDTHAFERIATVALPVPGRFNDGACDPAGRFWAGTFARDLTPGAGALYRFDAHGSATRVLDDVTVSNGMRWSPAGDVFYYVDSMRGSIDAFTFDASAGTLHDRRVAVALPDGGADGMTVDADGCLWVALWGHGEIRRFTPDGRHDRTIRVPAQYVTSCEFGGTGLETLYITSSASPSGGTRDMQPRPAGALFQCHPGVVGLPARPFAV